MHNNTYIFRYFIPFCLIELSCQKNISFKKELHLCKVATAKICSDLLHVNIVVKHFVFSIVVIEKIINFDQHFFFILVDVCSISGLKLVMC